LLAIGHGLAHPQEEVNKTVKPAVPKFVENRRPAENTDMPKFEDD
jgi:hypothetical protein